MRSSTVAAILVLAGALAAPHTGAQTLSVPGSHFEFEESLTKDIDGAKVKLRCTGVALRERFSAYRRAFGLDV